MTFSKNFKNFMYNIKKNRNFKNILKIKKSSNSLPNFYKKINKIK